MRGRDRVRPFSPKSACDLDLIVLNRGAKRMWQLYRDTVNWLFHLDSQEWFLAMCAALVIGFFALRGFGSRSNY